MAIIRSKLGVLKVDEVELTAPSSKVDRVQKSKDFSVYPQILLSRFSLAKWVLAVEITLVAEAGELLS